MLHRTRIASSLFLGSVAINIAIAWALERTHILSGEETSVSIRDPFFLELRQQYEPICTNIAAHLFYWVGQQLLPEPSLFFGRFQKAVAMGLVPVFVAAYVSKLRGAPLLTAALLALMPGFYLFAPLATEYGLECVTGMAALWLATSERASLRWLAAPLASWTALTYGAGVAFVPAIVWQALASASASASASQGGRAPSLRHTLLWLAGFAAPWVVPFVIWKNHPHLLTGGGTLSTFPALLHHLGQLAWESSVRGGSYYYLAEYPALSQPLLALGALAALAWLSIRREHGAVVVGWLAAVGVYVLSGREVGMRRGVPIVVFSMLALGLAWPALREALTRRRVPDGLARGAVALCFALCAFQFAGSFTRLAAGEWRVPLDFEFRVLPGKTMPETYGYLLEHPEAIDDTYEPERTWAVLHLLARKSAAGQALFSTTAIAERLHR
jgi:hypothetical protein